MKVNRARWIAVLYLGLAVIAAGIPVCTARASSSVNGSFSVSDTLPPATISLFVTSQSYTSVTLSWIAPGDDGNVGVAAEYDIRYSASAIDTEVKWQAATKVANPPSPKVAGSAESFIVDRLSPSSTYYLSIKTADEMPNWSGLSNSIHGNTLWYGEGTTKPSKLSFTEERGPTTGGLLEINMMDQEYSIEIGDDGTLGKALTLTDLNKNFVIDIAVGTKLTGSNGEVPSNVELKVTGLTGRFNALAAVVSPPVEPGFNWFMLDTSVGAAVATGLLVLYLVARRSRRTQTIGYNRN
jgi:hypothetical protein